MMTMIECMEEQKMIRGIAIFGLNGSGKSTLTHALAKQIDYFEMDVEDYYFPEQRESRRRALEDSRFIDAVQDELPYSNPKMKSEVQAAIIEDIQIHPRFILSGVTMNWSNDILSNIDIVFWVQTPLEERLRRIRIREEKRFGARILPGGDMYTQQMEFRKVVENRDPKAVEECARKFACPVIVLDGTLSVTENVKKIMDNLDLREQ